jgi:hypothetical protein
MVTGTDSNGCVGTSTISIKVNACNGLNEVENETNRIVIYPNPNNGNFNVKVSGDMQLMLINELGQVIKELSFTKENQFQQTIEGLSTGIYFIKGINNGSPVQNKLVVTQ